ncbi:hypothetical protein VFPPC_16331 [Pochonia chlamydosporia 170]|uniref:Uncharacterized protein n=1 Tax=Pochonia chlamydosporia 170 TaxID=1380566 RepID=A0A179FJ64_METCM|nr:hypothetical protein VFPPC_16331 [Pochonia chlamydosporia 170]OAQ65301.1 hypothetical protein VFPPC_16331 [Pochonia chlamydosporia 170]
MTAQHAVHLVVTGTVFAAPDQTKTVQLHQPLWNWARDETGPSLGAHPFHVFALDVKKDRVELETHALNPGSSCCADGNQRNTTYQYLSITNCITVISGLTSGDA